MEIFRCGWALDEAGQARKDVRIAVEDGTIAAIEPWSPTDAPYTDWSEYVVSPGFIDCHDHLGVDMGDEEAQAREHCAVNTLKAARNARAILRGGVTTVRDVGEKDHWDVQWREAIRTGAMVGPILLISGQFIMRTGGHGWYMGYQADGPDEVRKAVRTQVRAGVDWIKAMITGGISTEGLTPAQAEFSREEIAALVDEAHRRGRRVAVHAHGGEAVDWALEAGVDTVEHGVFCTQEQLRRMAAQGTRLVVTYEIIHRSATSDDVPEHYRRKSAEAIRRYLETIACAKAVGTEVAVGGDGWHGDPHAEAAALVQAGFSPQEAFFALTRNAARLLGQEGAIGSLAAGKVADLVALEGDPTTDVSAIERVRAVVSRGEALTG